MSQKATRRARRLTNDDDPPFKAPTPKPNGTEEPPAIQEEKESTPLPLEDEATSNDKEATPEDKQTPAEDPDTGGAVTRSRSATPQVKKTNGHEEDLDTSGKETETEMDPLIVADEPDPELVFEEGSDLESGKGSPILTRCKTRRSVTRNIPTPKTPKSVIEEEATPTPTPPTPTPPEVVEAESRDSDNQEELNVTFESCSENVSTKVEVGGDSTRLEYIEKDLSNMEPNNFLQGVKSKSFGETLRHLSTRRTIRPISDLYRKRLLQTNLERNDVSATYPSRNSVERISSVGLKRKSCSSDGDGEYRKRFKAESPGFFAKFTSPLASIKNTFRTDLPSSTPKLTGYKDEKFLLEDDGVNSQMCEISDGERRWCSIM